MDKKINKDQKDKITIIEPKQKEILYKIPDWIEDKEEGELEPCFEYNKEIYFLSEFLIIDKTSDNWMKEFDGYRGFTYFSGILIKFLEDNDEAINVYYFYQ